MKKNENKAYEYYSKSFTKLFSKHFDSKKTSEIFFKELTLDDKKFFIQSMEYYSQAKEVSKTRDYENIALVMLRSFQEEFLKKILKKKNVNKTSTEIFFLQENLDADSLKEIKNSIKVLDYRQKDKSQEIILTYKKGNKIKYDGLTNFIIVMKEIRNEFAHAAKIIIFPRTPNKNIAEFTSSVDCIEFKSGKYEPNGNFTIVNRKDINKIFEYIEKAIITALKKKYKS